MDIEEEIEKFEKVAAPASYYLARMPEKNKRGPGHVYYNARTQHAFEGWLLSQATVPAPLTSYRNATEFWLQKKYKCSSGDEVLALDVGYVYGWNACLAEMKK